LTDAFGTRLNPEVIERSLRGLGLETFQIVLSEDGWTLHHPGLPAGSDAVSLSATWLREKLSPLLPVHLETEAVTSDNEFAKLFIDLRLNKFETIAFAEVRQAEEVSSEMMEELLLRMFETPLHCENAEECSFNVHDNSEWIDQLISLQKAINVAFPSIGLNPKDVLLRIRMKNGRIGTVDNQAINIAQEGEHIFILLWKRPESRAYGTRAHTRDMRRENPSHEY